MKTTGSYLVPPNAEYLSQTSSDSYRVKSNYGIADVALASNETTLKNGIITNFGGQLHAIRHGGKIAGAELNYCIC